MRLPFSLGLFASLGALLILAAPPPARADVQQGNAVEWQRLDDQHGQGAHKGDMRVVPRPGRPGADHGPQHDPLDETPSAPVPEPGTLALASLGLVALGGAFRKRHAAAAAAKASRS